MAANALERVKGDVVAAMKAGDRELAGTLRMVVNALQQEAKEGAGDEVAVLQRERKRRIEAAEAYRDAGDSERAEREEGEAALIEKYMPAQLSDEELAAIVAEAIEAQGASSPGEVGKVMGAVMPRVKGRADGNRVSAAVRERLSGGDGAGGS